jgi:hypothetical protein
MVLIFYLLTPLAGFVSCSTYTTCSFYAIRTQAMDQLGYFWYYAGSRPISHGLQGHLHFSLGPSPFELPPVCSIVCRPCARSCEAKESALIYAFMYLNDVLWYTIGDVLHWLYHGTEWPVVVGVLHLVCNKSVRVRWDLICNEFISTY